MRKLLFLLLLLLVPVCAQATQVTMTATTIQNFHPSSLPNAVTGTLSATNNSTLVTGNFKNQWVNIAGYRINIAGVDYTVAATNSGSSITLTTVYAGTTGSKAFTVYPFILTRIYALRAFTSSTGELVQPGTPGSSSWYLNVGCSVIGTTLYIPQLILPSTTDAVNPGDRSATWFAGFYYLTGGIIAPWQGLTNFGLDFAPNPKTWAQAIAYANPGVPPPPNFETYSKSQIDTLFHQGGGGGGTGTVTSISTGTGLVGGPITTSGTISLQDISPPPASSCTLCTLTINSKGQITAASTGSAGSGTVTSITAGTGLNGGTITGTGTISLANVISGSSCTSCDLSFNSRGQITLAGNGSGGGGGGLPGQLVLRFNGLGQNVFAGYYWPAGWILPPYTYEAWAKPDSTGLCGCYIVADGYGGNHAILWGTDSAHVTGNMSHYVSGSSWTIVSFGSFEPFHPDEWSHAAVSFDGVDIYTFLNGVPSGIKRFYPNARSIPGILQGTSQFYVGGSDHNNFKGDLALLRGTEGAVRYGNGVFTPPRTFSMEGVTVLPVSEQTLNYDFTQGQHIVTDNSQGFLGTLHPGLLTDANRATVGPVYHLDPTAPTYDWSVPWYLPTHAAPAGPSMPVGALVWDPFTQNDRNPLTPDPTGIGQAITGTANVSCGSPCDGAHGSATITSSAAFDPAWVGKSGFHIYLDNYRYFVSSVPDTSTIVLTSPYGQFASTATFVVYCVEGGSLGHIPWMHSGWLGGYFPNYGWGIANGRLYAYGGLNGAYVDSGTSDGTIQSDVTNDAYSPRQTIIMFRYTDDSNFWVAAVGAIPVAPTVPDTDNRVYLRKYVGGSFTQTLAIETHVIGTLRVVLSGNTVQVWCDTNVGPVLEMTVTDPFNATATKHGFVLGDFLEWAGTSLVRWDNFAILP